MFILKALGSLGRVLSKGGLLGCIRDPFGYLTQVDQTGQEWRCGAQEVARAGTQVGRAQAGPGQACGKGRRRWVRKTGK